MKNDAAPHGSKAPASRFPRFLREFIHTESSSGIIMIAFAALSLLVANSPLSSWYYDFTKAPVTFGYGSLSAIEPFSAWVKDILMVFFFLVVGLELKREMCEGFLSRRDQILLPLAAAAGGMVAPALIYLALNHEHPANLAGWAIPSATDIAFALCILTLAGKGVAPSIKIFLLAIAIFDDLGAILVIAAFYSSGLAVLPLLLAALGVMVLCVLNRRNITVLAPYLLTGVYLWFCFHYSGIHTTVAGVAVGMAIPMRDRNDPRHSPLNRCMHFLHPWVSFLVLPLFAFTCAGVSLGGMTLERLLQPLSLGVMMGLFFGKQIGIFGMTWLLVTFRLASKPEGASWRQLYGVSVVAGIGFTMSLFIGLLAFDNAQAQEMAKLGVIVGSLLSAVWGAAILRMPGRSAN